MHYGVQFRSARIIKYAPSLYIFVKTGCAEVLNIHRICPSIYLKKKLIRILRLITR